MVAININASTYTLSATSSSSSVTLIPEDAATTSLVVYNSGTVPVFIVSGTAAPTAVFPTSATVPADGTVIAPGAIETLTKNAFHGFISGITATGTASVYIQAGTGD